MKILIFTSNFGNGHVRVAQALKKVHQNDDVFLANPQKDNSKLIILISSKIFDLLLKYSHNNVVRKFYGTAFNSFSSPNGSIFNKFGTEEVLKKVDAIEPDIIYFTFPYQPQKLNIDNDKVITVITDYGFSPNWYNQNSNIYIVGDESTVTQLHEINEKIKVLNIGIPIVGDGYIREEKKPKTVMFNLGTKGYIQFSRLKKILDELKKYNFDITIICGENKKLKNKIENKIKNDNITLLGFVNNIEEYYIKTDIMYTKAGGISITEAINYEIPLIIDSFISRGGQEELNIEFVEDQNIGVILKNKNDLSNIDEIINYKYFDKLNNMKKMKKIYEENKKENIRGF